MALPAFVATARFSGTQRGASGWALKTLRAWRLDWDLSASGGHVGVPGGPVDGYATAVTSTNGTATSVRSVM